jgi:hypothetical protein
VGPKDRRADPRRRQAARAPSRAGAARTSGADRGDRATKIPAPPTDCLSPIGEDAGPGRPEEGGRGRLLHRGHAPAGRLPRQPVPDRGGPGLRRAAARRRAGRRCCASPTACRCSTSSRPAPSPRRADQQLAQLRPAAEQGRAAHRPAGDPGAHRLGVGAVHEREQGSRRHYPEIIKEIKLGAAGVRPPPGLAHPPRPAREGRAQEASYIEKYIPHIGIALQEILASPTSSAPRSSSTLRCSTDASSSRKPSRRSAAMADMVRRRRRHDRRARPAPDARDAPPPAPRRSLNNVSYDAKTGYFKLKGKQEGAHADRQHGQDLRPDAAR